MVHRLRLLIGLLLLPLAGSCGEEKATAMLVDVVAREGVVSPREASTRTRVMTSLEATFSQDQVRLPQVLSKGGAEIELPTSFVLRADGREGDIQIELRARDNFQTLGEGSASGTLINEQQGAMRVTLVPADFGVNENRQGKQFFSTEGGFGRAVASGQDGAFVVVWEDSCGPLKRCDIWYRLFDKTGTPRINAASGKTDEFTANEGNAIYDMPTVAGQTNGGFLVAWQRLAGDIYKIYSRTFTADGRPDPASNSGSEVELTGTEMSSKIYASVPHAIALRDGGYLVVWQQTSTTVSWDLKGRYLGPNGMPTSIYNGSSEPFLVHSFGTRPTTCDNGKCDTGESSMSCPNDCIGWGPWPMAAPGANQGFMVAWNEDGVVRARPFGARAAPIRAALDVDSVKSKKVEEVTVAPLPTAYAVVWSDTLTVGSDLDGSSIRLKRLDLSGDLFQPGEQEFTVNTSTAGNQRTPAVAVRGDGSLLVTWATNHSDPDSEGGIRGRLLLHNLLPVGLDFGVNTTTAATQEQPGVAMHLSESFVAVFVDDSRTYPDLFESGIRARLLYPEYGTQDGRIGSLCDQTHPCGDRLSCQPTEAGPRCVGLCLSAGAACAEGGVCQLASSGENVCLFSKLSPP